MFKRKPVVFNVTDAHQRDLYEWCIAQSTNFSGFVKNVLFAYKNGRLNENNRQTAVVSEGGTDDYSGMADIL